MNFVFALMPLAIGIYATALLRGWILIRPDDPGFSKQWISERRFVFITCSVLSTFAGVCCLIYAFGLMPDLTRPH